MNTYRVTLRETLESKDVQAESAQQACEACGWLIGNCHVREVTTMPANEDWQRSNQRVRVRTQRGGR